MQKTRLSAMIRIPERPLEVMLFFRVGGLDLRPLAL
jgi:hypothetical protein